MANMTISDLKRTGENTLLRVALYGRVAAQYEMQSDAMENQLKRCQEAVAENKDWNVVKTYQDMGISGTQAKKCPSFMKMLEDAKLGKFDMVVVKDISRFGRIIYDVLHCCKELVDAGVRVYFVDNDICAIQDEFTELQLALMDSFVQKESRRACRKLKGGQCKWLM